MYPPPQSPIFMEERMSFDEVAWDQCDAVFAAWKKRLFNEHIFREIGALIIKHRGGPADELFSPQKGAFNAILRMEFLDSGSAIIRFPAPGIQCFQKRRLGGSSLSCGSLNSILQFVFPTSFTTG